MQQLSRRQMLKLMGIASAGAALAACAPGAAPAGGGAAAPATTPVRVTMVESWFGVPQFAESINPITEALSKKAQSEGVNIEFQSMILEDHGNKYSALYASGADFTMAFDAPWNKMNTLRDQGALAPIEGLIDANGPKLKEAVTDVPVLGNGDISKTCARSLARMPQPQKVAGPVWNPIWQRYKRMRRT